MNIHFNDKILLKDLNSLTLIRIKIGSHMYGLDNENSDDDYLSIYAEPIKNRYSYMWEHHQLQYKDDKTDYNFTSLQGFIRNALTGDATINFEVLFSEELKNSELRWLWEYRESFINYNIIKSYLGLAKRDLKNWKKDVNNKNYISYTDGKKLSHFVRGVIYAEMLLNGKFTSDFMNETSDFFNYKNRDLIRKIKESKFDKDFILNIYNHYEQKMDVLRAKLNDKLNAKDIVSYMDIKTLKEIDEKMITYLDNITYTVDSIDYKDLFYVALENGLNYN